MNIPLIILLIAIASILQFAFIVFIVIPIMRTIFGIATPPRALMYKSVAIISLSVNISILVLGLLNPLSGYLAATIILIYGIMRVFELDVSEMIGFFIISATFNAAFTWLLSIFIGK
jgi:hypothetical protein